MWLEVYPFQFLIIGAFSFVNLVNEQNLRGIATMGAPPHQPGWSADKAIDGDTNQNYHSSSCAITNYLEGRTSMWWRTWLQRPFNVAYLEIYFRSDTFPRATGFSIYTFDNMTSDPFRDPKNLVYHHDPMSGCPSPIQNITVNNVTQGILFFNERPPGYGSNCPGDDTMNTGVGLCEVKVMGCDQTRYSPDCSMNCSSNCKNRQCDVSNGSCIYGCSNPSALTLDCIDCNDGSYIKSQRCVQCQGHCKEGSACDKLTGRCVNGCQNYWRGDFCNICPQLYYGSDCSTPCGQCKGDDVCDNRTGVCPHGCKQHWQGAKCDECADGFFNVNCTSRCGHCRDNLACNKTTGYCDECKLNFLYPLCQATDVPSTDLYVAIAALAILLALTIAALIYMRLRMSALLQDRMQRDNTLSPPLRETPIYDNLASREKEKEYTTLDTVKQEPMYQNIGQ